MNQLKLYGKWLQGRFDVFNIGQNRRWLLFYLSFCLFWWLGAHLLFLKKYKRSILYLVAWLIIIGSWIAQSYVALPVSLFLWGIAFLLILFFVDFFYVFISQRKQIGTTLPVLVILFFFAVQVIFYEYLVDTNLTYINEQTQNFINHFSISSF